VQGFDNPKAFGKAIHLYIGTAIHLRKLGRAGLFALGTTKIFNPTVAGRHLPNMRLRCSGSTPTPLPHQTEPLPVIAALGILGTRYPSHDARFIGKYCHGGGQIFETFGHLVGRLKSARRQPFVDVQSYLQLPGPASQKFTLPALREAFDLLFDAKSFQRQVLAE
jgi:hypothetical protein